MLRLWLPETVLRYLLRKAAFPHCRGNMACDLYLPVRIADTLMDIPGAVFHAYKGGLRRPFRFFPTWHDFTFHIWDRPYPGRVNIFITINGRRFLKYHQYFLGLPASGDLCACRTFLLHEIPCLGIN